MRYWWVIIMVFQIAISFSQSIYFPPSNSSVWDTLSISRLGWCPDKVNDFYNYLDEQQTKSFILLKDGKIVLEKYFGSFTKDSLWIWYSAGKSLHSVLIGIAQEKGDLNINLKTSDYLGKGWTSLPQEKEDLITVRHQLTMTSGLNELAFFCVEPGCLIYKADAGTRWAYHNGPYDLLKDVLESASQQNINVFTTLQLKIKIGMSSGIWIQVPPNHYFLSTARDMARFGLLMQNKMVWNGNPVLRDTAYYNAMISSSQELNPSYGYLWWLNGKQSHIKPSGPSSVPGPISPHAPEDIFTAGGAMGQFVSVSRNTGLIMIRQGLSASDDLSGLDLHDLIWERIMDLGCITSNSASQKKESIHLYPNPSQRYISVDIPNTSPIEAKIYDLQGRLIQKSFDPKIDLKAFSKGIYIIAVTDKSNNLIKIQKIILQ